GQEPGRLNLRRHLRELQLDGLVLRDRLAERLALLGVADRLLERPCGDPDGARGDVHAAELDAAHEVGEACVLAGFAAENAGSRDTQTVERQLDGLDALVAELPER